MYTEREREREREHKGEEISAIVSEIQRQSDCQME